MLNKMYLHPANSLTILVILASVIVTLYVHSNVLYQIAAKSPEQQLLMSRN